LHALFNYIPKLLYLGCQWKELPTAKDAEGRPEIRYGRIYGTFRRWQAGGCFDIIFTVVVLKLRQTSLLDVAIIHGDGTTTAAKKGGDNVGFNGHKKIKGDKVVAFGAGAKLRVRRQQRLVGMSRWLDGISVRIRHRAYHYRPRTEPEAVGRHHGVTSAFADFCPSGGSPRNWLSLL
jgi:hypothetical protein